MDRPVGVIVVNYKKAERAVQGVKSILAQSTTFPVKVIVIDNSCDAQEWKILTGLAGECILLRSPTNVGYVKAVNQGLALCAGHDVVLMSPDIVADDDSVLSRLRAVLADNPDVGVIAPLQRNDDGSLVEIARSFPNPWSLARRRLLRGRRYESLSLLAPLLREESRLIKTDWIQSSFVMIRREVLDAVKQLDERYFLFMADVQLGLDAKAHGYASAVTRDCVVRGDGVRLSGGGALQMLRTRVGRIHYRDAVAYFFKNWRHGWA